MNTTCHIEIDAPAATVWDVYADVERWSDWTESIERVVALDGAGLQVGRRFEIKQPRFPTLVWEVTALEPGVSWTWCQRSVGSTTIATHEVVDQGEGRSLVRQGIEQRGLLGRLVGALSRRLTLRYLDLEAQGLKARSEARHHGAPTA